MSDSLSGEWRSMASAPRDGTRILVAIRATEQGPAEVDVVRWWSRPSSESGWLATDSDAAAPITYAEAELSSWMPLPSVLPRLRSSRPPDGPSYSADEIDGSAI